MGGLASAVGSLFGGESDAEKKARRAERASVAAADIEKKKKKKLKAEEAEASKAQGQRRVKLAARSRRVVTSPLGLGNEGLS